MVTVADSPLIGTARRQSLGAVLRRTGMRNAARPAIVCGGTHWTYADLDALVDRLAHGLARHGIAPGQRVAMMSRNSHAFVAVRFALARMGVVLVPINFMLQPDEVRYILDDSGACALFLDAEAADVGRQAAADIVAPLFGLPGETSTPPDGILSWEALIVEGDTPFVDAGDADALLQIIYTSGTESRPKGAMLTHAAVLWEYQRCIIDCEWTPDTVALHAMPLFHCAQLDCMLGPALQVGALNVITATATPERILPLLAAHGVTSFFAPPTVWIALLRSPLIADAGALRLAKGYYGASIMPVEVLGELQTVFPALRLWNLYGQTEIAPVATILFPDEQVAKAGSAGRPTVHVETRIVDDAMADVAVGAVGEVVHRSPQLMTGYWRNPEATAAAFAGGWFHSGDLATVDADGYITIVDRKKDMIKTGGENVSSREVEEALYGHPAVSEVAVVGLPHPQWIEAVTAFVVRKEGWPADTDDIMAHCQRQLSRFKIPKQIILVERLPRNAAGKILKRDLRDAMKAHYL